MVFYGAAFVTFYSAIKAPHLRRKSPGPEGLSEREGSL